MPTDGRSRAGWSRAGWSLATPTLVALLVGSWSITVPSLWRDESVSVHFARLPLGEAWRTWADVDAVHATYDLILRPFMWIEPVELALRLPSLLGFVVATVGVVLIGKHLSRWSLGLAAGLVYAVLPVSSRFAQEGRSYALVSAAGVFATLALLRAMDRPTPARFAVYAVLVAALGYLHLYALLLVVPHLLHAAITSRILLRRTIIALSAAGLLVLPLVVVAAGQRDRQLFWLRSPDLGAIPDFARTVGGTSLATVALGLLVLAGVWVLRGHPLISLWAFVPVAVSFTVSQWYPVYTDRYVLYVVPAAALLVGAAIDAVARRVRQRGGTTTVVVGAVALVAALALPTHLQMRESDSRPDDLRAMSRDLSADLRPGDGVLPVPERALKFMNVYGDPFERLLPVTVDELSDSPGRIWVITIGYPRIGHPRKPELAMIDAQYRLDAVESYGMIHMSLWLRRP